MQKWLLGRFLGGAYVDHVYEVPIMKTLHIYIYSFYFIYIFSCVCSMYTFAYLKI